MALRIPTLFNGGQGAVAAGGGLVINELELENERAVSEAHNHIQATRVARFLHRDGQSQRGEEGVR